MEVEWISYVKIKLHLILLLHKNNLKNWVKKNYGLSTFEYQYINVQRKVFAEKYLTDDIINYKVNCYNGEPVHIRVKKNVNGVNVNNIYDLNWTLTNLSVNYYSKQIRINFIHYLIPKKFKISK